MSEFAARIGRVRMKDGANVRILQSRRGPDGGDDWRGAIVRNARGVAEMGTDNDPLVGYILMGIFADGSTSFGYRYDGSATPIPLALFPAWIAEIVRREMVTANKARDVFHQMYEWRDN